MNDLIDVTVLFSGAVLIFHVYQIIFCRGEEELAVREILGYHILGPCSRVDCHQLRFAVDIAAQI